MTTANSYAPVVGHRWGATVEEWRHWGTLTETRNWLLPAVSNPNAAISPHSKMKKVGKTPSIYNRNGEAAGIPDWTNNPANTRAEAVNWSKTDDYGICLRTGGAFDDGRGILAFDVDVDDVAMVAKAEAIIEKHLGPDLPRRFRADSPRPLFLLRVEGEARFKTVIHTTTDKSGDKIEVLATGQQCLVAGTHEKGQRYQWRGALPTALPVFTPEVVDALIADLNQSVGVGVVSSSQGRKRGATVPMDDERGDWLAANWENYGSGNGGQLHILCPWKDGHSSDSGESECSYFPAGTSGYKHGHYKCLHASCEGRGDDDFDKATGYARDVFMRMLARGAEKGKVRGFFDEDEEESPGGGGSSGGGDGPDEPLGDEPEEPAPTFSTNKNGQTLANVANIEKFLRASRFTGLKIATDSFRGEVMCSLDGGPWRQMGDEDRTSIRLKMERSGFNPIKDNDLRAVINLVARDNCFDSAQDWLNSLKWDGVPRVSKMLHNYFNAKDSAYSEAVSAYWMTGHAARVFDPGHKCDMVPILVSPEGRYKSDSLSVMVPDPDQFIEVDLGHKDADLARRMRGSLLGEIAELRGLQGRSAEANKAWVTRRFEEWVPKYREAPTRHYRRLMFVGTTNEKGIIGDETGERRWLPVDVGKVARDKLKADRDQLWAEAAVMYRQRGHVWWEEAFAFGDDGRRGHRVHDAWEDTIRRWLDEPFHPWNDTTDKSGKTIKKGTGIVLVTMGEVLSGAIGMPSERQNMGQQKRAGAVMRRLGFAEPRNIRVDGKQANRWRRVK